MGDMHSGGPDGKQRSRRETRSEYSDEDEGTSKLGPGSSRRFSFLLFVFLAGFSFLVLLAGFSFLVILFYSMYYFLLFVCVGA